MPVDPFPNDTLNILAPYDDGTEITPDDSTDVAVLGRAFKVSTDGVVRVTLAAMADGETIDLYCLAGANEPARVKRFWQTGTTATGIVAIW